MKLFILFAGFFKSLSFATEIFLSEPIVQCTVVKVHSSVNVLGFKEFPKLYQSINNIPLDSKLVIAGKEFKELSPKTILKTENTEKIIIKYTKGQLELELKGKPISRNGTLRKSGKLLADITCH